MEEITRSIFENALIVNFNRPFRWRSGLKAPVYTDTRILLSTPSVRAQIVGKITEIIRAEMSDIAGICGIATGGLPWAAMAAHELNLPMIYVRATGGKNHGTRKSIEGQWENGARMVLVEDTISTGGAVLMAAATVRKYGLNPVGVVSVFSYGFSGVADRIRSRGMAVFTIVEFPMVVRDAMEHRRLSPSEIDGLRNWHGNPKNWKPGNMATF